MAKNALLPSRMAGKTVLFHGRYGYGQVEWLHGMAAAQQAAFAEELTAEVDVLVLPDVAAGVTIQKKVASLNGKGAAIRVVDAAAFEKEVTPTAEELVAILRAGPEGALLITKIVPGHAMAMVGAWRHSQPDLAIAHENLQGVDLTNFNLRGLSWEGCNLAGSILDGAAIYQAKHCDFRRCRGKNASFYGVEGSRFAGADLCDCGFTAHEGTDFSHAKLDRCRFSGTGRAARRPTMAPASPCRFSGASLEGAMFADTALPGATFAGAKLRNALLGGCVLNGADFSGADLRDANLGQADLTGCRFDGADLAGCNLYGAITTGVDFSRALHYDPHGPATGTVGPALTEMDSIYPNAKRIRVTFQMECAGSAEGGQVTIDASDLKNGWGARTPRGITNPRTANWSASQNMSYSTALLQAVGVMGRRKILFETVDVSSTKAPKGGRELRGLAIKGLEEAFMQKAPAAEELEAKTKAYRDAIREKGAAEREAREALRAQAEKKREKEKMKVEKKIEKAVGGKVKDLSTFLTALELRIEKPKIDKATKMLKASGFQLYNDVTETFLSGVVKSQTDADLVYACRINHDGTYACCTQNLNVCGGLRGSICKHLLVLIIGLVKAGELDPTTIDGWVAKSQQNKAELDKEVMGEVFIRYKGAEAGEVDWRPTETLPEDYYAV